MFRKNRQEYSHKIDMYFLCMVFSLFVLLFPSLAQANKAYGVDKKVESARHSEPLGQDVWRLKIQEAAIVRGDKVLLGEIAEPLGSISREKWQELAKKELWDSPPELGKPYKISKANLKNALRSSLGMYADSCLLPNALVLQRGGEVVREEKLRQMAMQYLTPQMNKLGGRSDLTDFRLPAYFCEQPFAKFGFGKNSRRARADQSSFCNSGNGRKNHTAFYRNRIFERLGGYAGGGKTSCEG